MNKPAAAALVTIIGLVLSDIGITGIDATVLNSAVNGIVSIVVIGAAVWSWYEHRKA